MTEESNTPRAVDEVVDLVSTLIRFDTSNTGELETTRGEEECAKWVASMLEEVGYTTQYVESGQPGRGNVFARLPGPPDSDRGALLIHGHLDVVPAEPADWSVHPFAGTVKDGYIWGRGAVDMKDMVGMALALARSSGARARRRRANWSSPSSPTRRQAGPGERTGSSNTGPICSRASPRPSAKSGAIR